MSILRQTLLSLSARLPAGTKTQIRSLAESLSSATKSSFYSQFGEDAFLQGYFEGKAWRRGTGNGSPLRRYPIPAGFYVDVGAFSPKQYSNTYAFYRRGWRGINIDPSPGGMAAFRRMRPHDISLELAISRSEGELEFYYWSVPAVVNTVSPEHARKWAERLGKEPQVTRVKTLPLSDILDRYLPPGQQISFLSVDAEGHDLDVLSSNNWSKYRPEIVLAESDENSIDGVVKSGVMQYMLSQRYKFISWLRPTLVFRDNTLPEIMDHGETDQGTRSNAG